MYSKSSISIKIASFSTNFKYYSPISVIRQFLISPNCDNINYLKDNIIEYDQKMPINNLVCKTSLCQISDFEQTYTICAHADSIFIFFDLESEESVQKFTTILSFIRERFEKLNSDNPNSCDLKIQLIGIFKNKSNIIQGYCKESILKPISEICQTYEYNELNINSSYDILKLYEKITLDALERKNEAKGLGLRFEDMSESNCHIF